MESPILRQIEKQAELLTQGDVLDLVARLAEIAKAKALPKAPIDWSRYEGILDPRLDPLEYQHAVRDEWE